MTSNSEREIIPFDQWLDMFRWVAAFTVLYTHTTNRFMLPVSDVHGSRSALHYAASFLSGFSHQAVMVFFVLSGFLVGGSLLREYRKSRTIDTRLYLLKRFARLWAVMLPALLLGFLANIVGMIAFPDTAPATYHSMLQDGGHSPQTFLCTAVFLHTAFCPAFAGNGPLWSIFNEFWYYVIWLLVFPLLFMRGNPVRRAALAALGAALLIGLTMKQFSGSPLGPYFLIWGLGVVVALLPRAPIRSPIVTGALLFAFLLVMRLGVRREFWETSVTGTFGLDLLLGILFALLIVALRDRPGLARPPGGSSHLRLARFSFTLYCVHAPLLNLYGVAMRHWFGIDGPIAPHGLEGWLYVFAPVLVMPGIAYLVSLVTEEQTSRFRRALDSIVPHWPGLPRAVEAETR